MTEKYIYKICAKAEWDSAVAAGVYNGSRIDEKSGFIHFSTAEQAVETASKHFFGIHGLVLIKIDSESLGDALKWEKSRNDALFPHLYGPLQPGNAEWAADLPIGDDGTHVFPPTD
ncbi:MAG: DUF952 domain-containing protein [Alphaproteobacteria bacterium]|jgi:uncharacterized protein (DUF952 family)|nr:DUF952 domain-containing protein [Alphaproteobacteria bacterium]